MTLTLLVMFAVCFVAGFTGAFAGLVAAIWYCSRRDA